MASHFVAGFKPSNQGFHFENDFEDGAPVIKLATVFGDIPVGNAGGGLCGGMVFAALDLFRRALAPPADTIAPKPGTPLFDYIAHRLVDSFNGVAGVNKYLEWMRLPDDAHLGGFFKSIAWHSVHDEWPAIRADLDADRPCPLGLILVESVNPVELGKNHQVLAYGYEHVEATGLLQVFIYDPNWPDRDDVTLAVNIADVSNPSHVVYSVDSAGRGFFRNEYIPKDPSAAVAIA